MEDDFFSDPDHPRRLPFDLSGDLEMVFTVDVAAWSPRKLVYAAAVESAEATGSRMPSPTEVYSALRARGFREAKRRGVWGFKGIRVSGRADEPRVMPAGTASAYYHRNERTERARSAKYVARAFNKLGGNNAPSASPWFETPWTAMDRADAANSRRRGRRPSTPRLSPDEQPKSWPSIDD
jgi:hypothetical protein